MISAEMLRKSRVRNFIASFIVAHSQVVLLAFAIQRRGVDAQGLGGLVQRVAVASTAPMCAFSSSSRLSAAPMRGALLTGLFGHAQVADLHAFLRADDARPLHHVAQFANVARPAVAEQRLAGLIAETTRRTRSIP